MKTMTILLMALFLSSVAYCQPIKGIDKEEAIKQAREWAEASNPPMSSTHMKAHAVYMPDENSWIVDFEDESSTVADSDYMLRVEASSGKSPELLRGSQKQRYSSYFEK